MTRLQEPYIDYSVVPDPFPHPLAEAWGEDDFGWWMRIEVLEVVQVFRWIFPGQFWMGSPEEEPRRFHDEIQHLVTLTNGFWLADTACTQELWKAVMGENPANFRESEQNPVEKVSGEDVTDKFLPKLAKLTGLQGRLPTEAEWEYACRAGTTTPFNLGKNITSDQVNFNGKKPYDIGGIGYRGEKVAVKSIGQYRGKTVAVKSMRSPNAWGLHEMHGNVYEWCQGRRRYGGYAESNLTYFQAPETAPIRILRGGSWYSGGDSVRSAFSGPYSPADPIHSFGFRLALGQPVRSTASQ